jgi:triacylglycerol lipase
MTSWRLVDPALRPLLEAFPTAHLTAETLPDVRARTLPIPPSDVTGITLDRIGVPGPPGAPDVTLHIYAPEKRSAALPCIYHMHGGGFVTGSAAQFEPMHRRLAAELGCVIVSADYRLAPEHRFPAAIDDCYAGLRWLFDHAAEWGVDAGRIGVMGESAGGGLAASLALMARDKGEFPLAFQHLIYPMLDDRTCLRKEPRPFVGEYIWTASSNHFAWSALLGHAPGGTDVSPYAAAARAASLQDLPPTFIAVGALDLFVEEDIDYARRLIDAGVPVELHIYPGAFHGFDLAPEAAISVRARRTSLEALRRTLPPAPIADRHA